MGDVCREWCCRAVVFVDVLVVMQVDFVLVLVCLCSRGFDLRYCSTFSLS